MDKLKVLLIANRGEIAVRLIRTAKRLGIRTIAIYATCDSSSIHVGEADKAVRLSGPDSAAYLDGDQIIGISLANGVDAIIPGYGFLSENADFARAVARAGICFVGPSPRSIDDFGIKHTARELARAADVPIVPGTAGLVDSGETAVEEAQRLGFPVMLKATAGGGGMGLLVCSNAEEVRASFETAKSRGEALFKNAGVFIEKFFPDAHHVEVQVFGNGQGKAIHFGERECSIQRRHQKVIEECPSPFVEWHLGLREKMCSAAVKLAESIQYGSAGTIEYLVDDHTAEFFFLEMNTRLQVEHGITELCYDVDLVEMMLRQADAELLGKGGLGDEALLGFQKPTPKGSAIEARVYAENPVRNFAPSPGLLQEVTWKLSANSRVDTWVHRGTRVSANYDPLLAKVMTHSISREEAVEGLIDVLQGSKISGPPTNLDFLVRVLDSHKFRSRNTPTSFLDGFEYSPSAIDVIAGGAYTLVEDWPGRPTVGRGFGHAGPMDPLAFRIGNLLVGNPQGTAGLEITLSGPDLKFLSTAVVAFCGAPFDARLDGEQVAMWRRKRIEKGQRLVIGKATGSGCRAYLAIFGGLPGIASWFGSKSTAPMTVVGGYQGRALAASDLLEITADVLSFEDDLHLPQHLVPVYTKEWHLSCMPGPYDEGYLTDDFIDEFYGSTYEISHNAARGGIRLIGPKPRWARSDGGEGGAHPSNTIEYGYPLGALNWTGDDPCLFPADAPDFGGFVSSLTVIKADWWRMGQMKAGDRVRFHRTSKSDALVRRSELERFVSAVENCIFSGEDWSNVRSFNVDNRASIAKNEGWESALIRQIPEGPGQPLVSYRQGGDDFLLVEYGHGSFDLNYRCRAVTLYRKFEDIGQKYHFGDGIIHVGLACGNSLILHFDSTRVNRDDLVKELVHLEQQMGDLSRSRFPGRRFKLPITFRARAQIESLKRYMETQRPYASYLPDPLAFVAKNNGLTVQQLCDVFTKSSFMVVAVGFFIALPIALPIDPRQRIQSPKMNPSRIHTPEGQVGWGGSCMSIYNVESPGGYMNIGLSVPGADVLGFKNGYNQEKPWLFDDFDQITFYEVTEEEYESITTIFHSGHYEYSFEDIVFDLKKHNELLDDTKDEVAEIRQNQRKAQKEMDEAEANLLDRWNREKKASQISDSAMETLLSDPDIVAVEAPVNANVWKVEATEGNRVGRNQIVAILEAMKLEINVCAEDTLDGCVVEKVLAKPGDIVQAGRPLMLLRKV